MIIIVKIKFKEKEKSGNRLKAMNHFYFRMDGNCKWELQELIDIVNSESVQDVWGIVGNRNRQLFDKDLSSHSPRLQTDDFSTVKT